MMVTWKTVLCGKDTYVSINPLCLFWSSGVGNSKKRGKTYGFTRSTDGHKAREEAISDRASLAGSVEATLDDGVVLGVEVVFNDISHNSRDGVGNKG